MGQSISHTSNGNYGHLERNTKHRQSAPALGIRSSAASRHHCSQSASTLQAHVDQKLWSLPAAPYHFPSSDQSVNGPRSVDVYVGHHFNKAVGNAKERFSTRGDGVNRGGRSTKDSWSDIASDLYRVKSKPYVSQLAFSNLPASKDKLESSRKRNQNATVAKNDASLPLVTECGAHVVSDRQKRESRTERGSTHQHFRASHERMRDFRKSRSASQGPPTRDELGRSRSRRLTDSGEVHISHDDSLQLCDITDLQNASNHTSYSPSFSRLGRNQNMRNSGDLRFHEALQLSPSRDLTGLPRSYRMSPSPRSPGSAECDRLIIETLRTELQHEQSLRSLAERKVDELQKASLSKDKKLTHLQEKLTRLEDKYKARCRGNAEKRYRIDAEDSDGCIELRDKLLKCENENAQLKAQAEESKRTFEKILEDVAMRMSTYVKQQNVFKVKNLHQHKRVLDLELQNHLLRTQLQSAGMKNQTSNRPSPALPRKHVDLPAVVFRSKGLHQSSNALKFRQSMGSDPVLKASCDAAAESMSSLLSFDENKVQVGCEHDADGCNLVREGLCSERTSVNIDGFWAAEDMPTLSDAFHWPRRQSPTPVRHFKGACSGVTAIPCAQMVTNDGHGLYESNDELRNFSTLASDEPRNGTHLQRHEPTVESSSTSNAAHVCKPLSHGSLADANGNVLSSQTVDHSHEVSASTSTTVLVNRVLVENGVRLPWNMMEGRRASTDGLSTRVGWDCCVPREVFATSRFSDESGISSTNEAGGCCDIVASKSKMVVQRIATTDSAFSESGMCADGSLWSITSTSRDGKANEGLAELVDATRALHIADSQKRWRSESALSGFGALYTKPAMQRSTSLVCLRSIDEDIILSFDVRLLDDDRKVARNELRVERNEHIGMAVPAPHGETQVDAAEKTRFSVEEAQADLQAPPSFHPPVDCADSTSSFSEDDDSEDDGALTVEAWRKQLKQRHRLGKMKRHAVVRYSPPGLRPSVLRSNVYHRFGAAERSALALFGFLHDISGVSSSASDDIRSETTLLRSTRERTVARSDREARAARCRSRSLTDLSYETAKATAVQGCDRSASQRLLHLGSGQRAAQGNNLRHVDVVRTNWLPPWRSLNTSLSSLASRTDDSTCSSLYLSDVCAADQSYSSGSSASFHCN